METRVISQPTAYEQKLVRIVRKLPPERVSQVIDFAQFLELQVAKARTGDWLDEDESEEEIAVEDARWDALLATDEAQRLLEQRADEALADVRAGRARPMVFTEDGDLVPG